MIGVFFSFFLMWPFWAAAGTGLVLSVGVMVGLLAGEQTGVLNFGLFAHGNPYFMPLLVVIVFGVPALCVWLARWERPRKFLALAFVIISTVGAPALMAHEKAFGYFYTFEKNYFIGICAIAALWLFVFAGAGLVLRRVLDGPAGQLYESHFPFMMMKRRDTFLD